MTGPKIRLSDVKSRWEAGAVPPPAQARDDVAYLLEQLDQMRANQSAAVFELVLMAQELNWATDGQLSSAVRHARGVLDARTEQRDRALQEVADLRREATLKPVTGDQS